MSEPAAETQGEERPRRARVPRIEAKAASRRRRKAGTLNRMVQMTLDIFDPDQLDLETYVYRWINDEKGRIRQATKQDDYDFVSPEELGESFDVDETDHESSERVRMIVGDNRGGKPIYAYLCRKRRAFWESDNQELVQSREDMMAGRVFRGEFTEDEEIERNAGDEENFYVPDPANKSIGLASGRRRGPIPRKF